jgi:simple sugar transport system ATP-binding protein
VAENAFVYDIPAGRLGLVDRKKLRAEAEELLQAFDIKARPETLIRELGVAQQQLVEIAKAFAGNCRVLILDEPTSALAIHEEELLFEKVRQLREQGTSVIYITHKLREVFDLADRVTVLRDGRVVGSRPTQGATRAELAEMMVGRPVILQYDRAPLQAGESLLDVQDLVVGGDRGSDAVRGVTFSVRAGEILGLAGVSGNGQRELAQALAGLRPARRGRVLLNGREVTHASPDERILAGQSYIPEERMRDGAIKDFSVTDNLVLEDHGRRPFARGIFLDFKAIREHSHRMVQSFNVKTPSLDTPLKSLSGGNIQKLILARELSRKPRVLIAAQPTRGVDIGASEYIHQRLLEQRQSGTATLLISEDLDEIRALSDRIAVIYEGQVVGIVDAAQATTEQLGLMMAGAHEKTGS